MCKLCQKNPVITLSGDKKLCKNCFIHYFEKKVLKTIRVYKLLNKKDKVIVACSGGKDSTTILYLLNKFAKQRRLKPVEAIAIDLAIGDYTKKNMKNITSFCKKNKIKLYKISIRKKFGYSVCYIKSILASKGLKLTSCTICGALRRYLLNKEARKLKATKLVTGHNLDDEAQSILMNQFKGNFSLSAKLGPITGVVKDIKFVQRVKPLYFCTEQETELYSKLKKFPVVYKRCPCVVDSYRNAVRNFLNKFEKKYAGTKNAIVNSFLEILPLLKKKYKAEKIGKCKICKEPSAKEICKTCEILKKLSK